MLEETLRDIKNDIVNIFEDKLVYLIGYGSFFMQKGELDPDKKPDFIAVVEDYSVYDDLGCILEWDSKDIQENKELNKGTINYYNIVDHGLRFKIGIISKDDMRDMASRDLYLSGRLSKKVYPVYCKTMKERVELEHVLEKVRKRFVKKAFELQKGQFTIDDVLKSYIAISYMAEMYRYLTIDRKKPTEILEKTRPELLEQLEQPIQEYAETHGLSNGHLKFNPAPNRLLHRLKLYSDFILKYSRAGIKHSLHNSKTNKYSNDQTASSGKYMVRKFKNMFK